MDENIILTEENASAFSDDELIEFSRKGEELATATLITRHKGLISKVSRKYFISRGFDQEDFVQEATLAFIKSIKSYSASKGSQFSYVKHGTAHIHRQLAGGDLPSGDGLDQLLFRALGVTGGQHPQFNAGVVADQLPQRHNGFLLVVLHSQNGMLRL